MSSPNTPPKVISPSKLAHVVLRTNNFHSMVKFYKTFLGGYAVFENEHIAFITYDDEHHRIAIIHQPHLKSNDGSTTGLEHIAFTFDSLKDLCTAYKQRKEHGIIPGWCVNHGPTTSMYYRDPDGNEIETQVDNFDDPDKATEMMNSEAFQKNVLGADYDPEELCRKVDAGLEEEEALKARKDVGVRGVEDIKNIKERMVRDSRTGE